MYLFVRRRHPTRPRALLPLSAGKGDWLVRRRSDMHARKRAAGPSEGAGEAPAEKRLARKRPAPLADNSEPLRPASVSSFLAHEQGAGAPNPGGGRAHGSWGARETPPPGRMGGDGAIPPDAEERVSHGGDVSQRSGASTAPLPSGTRVLMRHRSHTVDVGIVDERGRVDRGAVKNAPVDSFSDDGAPGQGAGAGAGRAPAPSFAVDTPPADAATAGGRGPQGRDEVNGGVRSAGSAPGSGQRVHPGRRGAMAMGHQGALPPITPHPSPQSSAGLMHWHVGRRYELRRELGRGSYGAVAEGVDTWTGRRVAVKRIHNLFRDARDAKRILREVTILRHLEHPNIIKLVNLLPPADWDNFDTLYAVFEVRSPPSPPLRPGRALPKPPR